MDVSGTPVIHEHHAKDVLLGLRDWDRCTELVAWPNKVSLYIRGRRGRERGSVREKRGRKEGERREGEGERGKGERERRREREGERGRRREREGERRRRREREGERGRRREREGERGKGERGNNGTHTSKQLVYSPFPAQNLRVCTVQIQEVSRGLVVSVQTVCE